MRDPRSDLKAASASLDCALAGLAALPARLDRPLIGAHLTASQDNLQRALASMAPAIGLPGPVIPAAMETLEGAVAAIQRTAPSDHVSSVILGHIARAASHLSSAHAAIEEASGRRLEPVRVRSAPPAPLSRRSGIPHRWSPGRLELRHLDRSAIPGSISPKTGVGVEEDEDNQEPSGPIALVQGAVTPVRARLLSEHFIMLGFLLSARLAALRRQDATVSGLRELEQRLFHRIEVIAWLGEPVAHELLVALHAADDSEASFAAAAPLLSIAGSDTAAAVFRALGKLPERAVSGVLWAMRLAPHPDVAHVIADLFCAEQPQVRAGAIWIASDRGGIAQPAALSLLEDPSPEVVTTCARALACAARRDATPVLEWMLDRGLDDGVGIELAAAAAVLGSGRALARLRQILDQHDEPPESALAAIAACGDERDVDALARIALKGTAQAPAAIRGLGWLGSSAAFEPLKNLLGNAELRRSAAWALMMIAGAPDRLERKPGRSLLGEPWSAEALIRLLHFSEIRLSVLRFGALELIARMGLAVAFDHQWPIDRQLGALGTVEGALKPHLGRLPKNTWLPIRAGPGYPCADSRRIWSSSSR